MLRTRFGLSTVELVYQVECCPYDEKRYQTGMQLFGIDKLNNTMLFVSALLFLARFPVSVTLSDRLNAAIVSFSATLSGIWWSVLPCPLSFTRH